MFVLTGAAANLANAARQPGLTAAQRSRLMRLSDQCALMSEVHHKEMTLHDEPL